VVGTRHSAISHWLDHGYRQSYHQVDRIHQSEGAKGSILMMSYQ
jgi:hypothetical protein